MTKYPLIEAIGLEVHILERIFTGAAVDIRAVKADELEAALDQAPVVYAPNPEIGGWTRTQCQGDIHTARLVCIQPIVRDTAESLLRELAHSAADLPALYKLAARARKLLQTKETK
jgi:uncharacterized protein (DUF488 family)